MILRSKLKQMFIATRNILWGILLGRFPRLQARLRHFFKEGPGRSVARHERLSFLWSTGQIQDNHYPQWLQTKAITARKRGEITEEIKGFQRQPRISIIMPVYNVDSRMLKQGIESVKGQIYSNWELNIVDDGSTNPETTNFLQHLDHPQINIKFHSENRGIAATSNTAIAMAGGEYIAIMDHDDELTENALFEVVKAININDPDLIYSDEDKLDERGKRVQPFFKPDWSPDLLRCQNYICHLAVIKKTLLNEVKGFREGFEGAQDHDLFLRISEKTDNIVHIPKILYSWRKLETSTASSPRSKPYAQAAGLKAINAHLERVFKNGSYARRGRYLFVHDARFPQSTPPFVSIIIPTKDNLGYLKACVNSILSRSDYRNYEIIILNNNSEKAETRSWLERMAGSHGIIKVLEAYYPFCWSKLNNHGISEARGDVYIFLNNDTQVISRNWISKLAEQALRADVGAVGPLLLYADNTIQHAGVVVGMGGWADHLFKGMPADHFFSPYLSPMVRRNVLAVTGSCLAISKVTIDSIGNFDENFTVCGSDVEICLRAHAKGFLNIYDPFVQLYHFESKTRVPQDIPDGDFKMSKIHYRRFLESGDPYYNVNLALDDTTPRLKAT